MRRSVSNTPDATRRRPSGDCHWSCLEASSTSAVATGSSARANGGKFVSIGAGNIANSDGTATAASTNMAIGAVAIGNGNAVMAQGEAAGGVSFHRTAENNAWRMTEGVGCARPVSVASKTARPLTLISAAAAPARRRAVTACRPATP